MGGLGSLALLADAPVERSPPGPPGGSNWLLFLIPAAQWLVILSLSSVLARYRISPTADQHKTGS